MIIFNIYAVIQGVIVIVIVMLFEYILQLIGLKIQPLSTQDGNLLYGVSLAFILAFTDVKGLKGTLFWIPTWIVMLILINILFFANSGGDNQIVKHLLLYSSTIGVIVFYFWLDRKQVKAFWTGQKQLLAILKQQISNNQLKDGEFWKAADHIFFQPPFLFIRANVVWQIFYSTAIPFNEFVSYYRDFINLINTDEIEYDLHKKFVIELKGIFNKADSFKTYVHSSEGFTNLGYVIELMNKRGK